MGKATKFVGTSQAASMLQISPRIIRSLCRNGYIEGAERIGRNWKIPEASIEKYKESNRGEVLPGGPGDWLLSLAVGSTSYIEMSSDCYYVDKTLLIKELIDDHNLVTLITRPRRFGKSLALNMLKTFFEKTGEDTSKYFVNRDIWKCGEKYQKMQGAYPVIMLSFKDVKYDKWEDSFEAIKLIIQDEYARHSELFLQYNLNYSDRRYVRRMEDGSLSDVEYSRALLNLTRMLSLIYGTKVVVLIDEYDTPIQQGYSNGFYYEVLANGSKIFAKI